MKSKTNEGNKGLIQFLSNHPNLQASGNVVAIYKRQQRSYCGSIDPAKLIYSSKNNSMKDEGVLEKDYEIYEFVPADSKFCNFYIRTFKS